MTISAPRWDMTNVYPALDSKQFKSAIKKFRGQLNELETFLKKASKANSKTEPKKLGKILGEAADRFNALFALSGTIGPYIYSFITTDSRNKEAMRILSEFEQVNVQTSILQTKFAAWAGKLGKPAIKRAVKFNPSAKAHEFTLLEAAEQSKYLMSEAEETLAAELTLSGGNAFGKLQGTLTSQMTVDFELDGKTQKMPMPALINLRSHPDEATRRRAYEAENIAWEGVKETLAACLNGVKGETLLLDKKRGREDNLHASIDAARMDRATLDAMLGAMKDSFPMFRRYFKHKAKLLGREKLAWWDIFAPLGKTDKVYSWDEARGFIVTNFNQFSPELGAFAARAFDSNWIDGEQREGKRGGAFCMGLEGVKESRILSNYDGSFDQVSTLAHELGHAFHNECAWQAGKTPLQQQTPMTLAETASIMCETIVTEAALAQTTDRQEILAILEAQLNNASQVVVDIYSRYLFEKEVFERRAQAELSADEINDIMERAQKAAYGDGLDENSLQKFMWTWKPHYYSSGFSFYNYPYAFGLLFATGLYAIYQKRGAEFVPAYKRLLASTGEARAADLADGFGINIRAKKFWADSLAIIAKRADRFCEL
ncbi:MAG: oligoendopeptidase F [Chloroflexi bacterium]|nr:M3 family oligoendopeptidase [Chloroflexi bacterium CFX1]MCK6567034.1 M3 family oligoendopeptidase [Anaerolineales bacterium]MCQ3952522.1 oligoendopeptidase F [Chloroflexota bacterium]MDL1918951.1 M3 family oligoendopeptidase [Chloroflexi bacterium CFX5]NUQ59818.1 M3 family oligoendopeptidase [Anaerolineales bacterium]